MKKSSKKIIALCLCALLTAGTVGATVFAGANNESGTSSEPEKIISVIKDNDDKNVKDETVYVIANADGSVSKIIVSDWIKNHEGSSTLTDKSNLKDVYNVKGDESFTLDGSNARVWSANGKDIYCQGTSDEALPVDIKVTYSLDGKTVSPDEIKGKGGHVVIRYEYTNNIYETVEIDGEKQRIFVPFAMLTGMLLDGDNFSNIKVTNGKVINDGSRVAVIGVALPGMQESLGISKDKFEFPDYVEVSADVTAFEMTSTMTIAANSLFNKIDTSKLGDVDKIEDRLTQLEDAMKQLTDGSSALYDGLCTLLEKSDELVKGIDQLADGAKQLNDGAGSLSDGSKQLSAGASALNAGLGQLAGKNSELNAGAKQVYESLLGIASSQITAAGIEIPALTIDNYPTVLESVLKSLDESVVREKAERIALEKVTSAVNAQRDVIKAKVSEAVESQVRPAVEAKVRESVRAQVLATLSLDANTYEQGVKAGLISEEQQKQIEGTIEMQMQSDNVKALIKQNVAAQMANQADLIESKTEEQVQLLIKQNMASDDVRKQIEEGVATAKAGAASITALKQQFDSYKMFYTGLAQYTAGVSSAASGAKTLANGAAQLTDGSARLSEGAAQLLAGILQLKDNVPALVEGVTQLKDGAMQLSDGIGRFNEEGIRKLVDAVDGDIAGLVTRLRAVADVSKDYTSFSGLADDMEGQVRFIYKTASVK